MEEVKQQHILTGRVNEGCLFLPVRIDLPGPNTLEHLYLADDGKLYAIVSAVLKAEGETATVYSFAPEAVLIEKNPNGDL